MQSYISTSTAALLTGEDRRRVFEKITDGTYETRKQSGGRGGNGGESYQIAVSSLPVEAQIIYAQRGGVINGPINDDCDLAGYHARFGDNGMRELLGKQRAVLEGLAIRKLNPEDVVEQLAALAEDHGTSLRTLYRWMDAYEEKGLPGIMRAVSRKDKGTRPSICAAAYQYAYGLYADKVKRTQATIYNKLVDKAAVLGPDACQKCIFCEGTEARARLMETGDDDRVVVSWQKVTETSETEKVADAGGDPVRRSDAGPPRRESLEGRPHVHGPAREAAARERGLVRRPPPVRLLRAGRDRQAGAPVADGLVRRRDRLPGGLGALHQPEHGDDHRGVHPRRGPHGTQPVLRPARPPLHRQRQGLPQQDLRDRPDGRTRPGLSELQHRQQ
jgi:hypothetical protein